MNNSVVSEMLLARLEISHPDVSALLVAAPTSRVSCRELCDELANAARRLGRCARVVTLTIFQEPGNAAESESQEDTSPSEARHSDDALDVETLRHQALARALIHKFDGLSLVVGRGVLDDPATLMAIRAVDGVMVAARVGKTLRSDLEKTRLEVERVGGSVVGAIELH